MEYIKVPDKENFFFRVAQNKISFGYGNTLSKEHYTLNFGVRSKILDIHITKEGKAVSGNEKHKGKYFIRHYTIRRILVYARNVIPTLDRFFLQNRKPLSVLNRLNLSLFPIEDERILELLKIDKKGTRAKLQKRIRKDLANELVGDVFQVTKVHTVKPFIAFSEKKGKIVPYGVVYAYPQKCFPKSVFLFGFQSNLSIWKHHFKEVFKIIEKELKTEKQQILGKELQTFLRSKQQAKTKL